MGVIGAGFDFFPNIAIYKGTDLAPIDVIDAGIPAITEINPDISDPCIQIPDIVCVEEGIYEFEYTFAEWPSNDSYFLTYQRCCRNATVDNIQTPGNIGATFTVEILPAAQAVCNNSPSYNTFPPIVICAGQMLEYDHAATDVDGDQLIYEMCAPLIGGGQDGLGGGPGTPTQCDNVVPNPPCPPPYETVTFINPPYSIVEPLAGDPAVTINPTTGLLSGTPLVQGQFVVGICINEFRNGELMSVIRRDFQFNVANCQPVVEADVNANLQDSIYTIAQCNDFEVFIENMSIQEEFIDVFFWEFDVNGQPTTYTDWSPTITFPNHGTFDGQLSLNPGSDCGDTAYVRVIIHPEVVADFTMNYDTCISGPVFFDDASYFIGGDSEIVSWDWDFGNDSTSTFHSPTLVYKESGDYLVQLAVVDENGCDDLTLMQLSYQPAPALIIIAPSDVVSCPPAEVTFNNLSDPINNNYTVNWSFGDGDSINAISPTHIYQEPGIYDVALEIISPINCQVDTVFSGLIDIQDPPVADFSFDPAFATNIEPEVSFSETSANAAAWEWFINGELVSHDQNPIMSFLDTGWQEVTLIVTHPEDCKDTMTQLIDVVPIVFYHLPNAFTPNNDTSNDFFLGKGIIPGITDFQFIIWDRWGKQVFKTNDPLEGWNGQVNNAGRNATPGNYIYTVSFTGPRGAPHQYKGNALLYR